MLPRSLSWMGLLALGTCLAGCVSMPEETLSRAIGADELSGHVHFLAQPALRGRRPMTLGSLWARRYIDRRFAAYGLVPWGQANSYAQSFGIGTNMIGVLRGSDPNLAGEVVIVSAHYDHLGKTEDGLCPGACDNASGMAALLEIAEYLALSPERPARSVCFAAFDQEENALLGAFAFSRRPDFDPSRIAGVINIDLLGRRGFEVLDQHLFVAGISGYPSLQAALRQADPGIEILPVGTDLVGARGDHVAFDGLDVCSLFFTCGPYRDYHKPTDTPDKIDYQQTRAASQVILASVRALSESAEPLARASSPDDGLSELETLKLCLERIERDPNALGWTSARGELIAELSRELDRHLDAGQWNGPDRRRLLLNHFEILSLLLSWPEASHDPNAYPDKALQQHMVRWRGGLLNLDFRPEIIAAGQALVDHLAKHSASLFWGVPDFEYQRTCLRDDYLHLLERGEGQYSLICTLVDVSLDVRLPGLFQWPPRTQAASTIGISWLPRVTQGTRQEIFDICLLGWGRTIDKGEPNAYWQKILSRVTALSESRTYEQWLQWHLDRGRWSNENEWMKAALQSDNPYLARSVLRRLPDRPNAEFEPVLAQIMADPEVHPYVRTGAIAKVHGRSGVAILRTLANLIDDKAPREGLNPELPADHPQADLIRFITSNRAKEMELLSLSRRVRREMKKGQGPPRTVGGYALERLKKLTGRDFGLDKQAWNGWIASHY